MSNLKDTDIEDLFRRASEKYPLRTDSADWDRMAAALEKDPPSPPDGEAVTDNRRKRRFLWLLLLLPLAGVGYYALQGNGHGKNAIVSGAAQGAPARVEAGTRSGNAGGNSGDAGDAAASGAGGHDGRAVVTAGAVRGERGAVAGGRERGERAVGSGRGVRGESGVDAGGGEGSESAVVTGGAARGERGAVAGGGVRSERTVGTGSGARGRDIAVGAGDTKSDDDTRNGAGMAAGNAFQPGEEPWRVQGAQLAFIPRDYFLSVPVKASVPEAVRDSSHNKKNAKPPVSRHFYAGILGSPDISTVKMQAVKGTGSTFGLLLGYSFNPRWSIETGIYADRKHYYTDGEYFNTKNIYMQPNWKLVNANGVCYMWEIPLNVRYNFNPGARTAWFTTAGFSTYLMSEQKYVYDWKSGTYEWDANADIKKASQYPFSIVNLSVGFEQRLGKVGSLRLEPYARIPLAGIGTGKLPIMSAGVNIGITRQLW